MRDRQARILIVDDTHENMEIIGKMLEQEGYDLYLADNGVSAIDLVEKIDFDLILMDIMMPDMDGFETTVAIRQLKPDADVPVILLTAKVDIESVVKGFEIGAADYVRKPFNALELKARVKYQLSLGWMRSEIEFKNRCLQEAYDQLKQCAILDPLTKLFNRSEIMERLQHEINRFERSGKTFSILIGDIDDFKQVNDTYGHQFGDFVLQTMSDLFVENLRKQDSVSRWGGDEFLFLLPETDEAGAVILAEKLRKAIEESSIVHANHQVSMTMTFGICCFEQVQSYEALIDRADEALYQGKADGRNRVAVCNQHQKQVQSGIGEIRK
jgi:diguanylate cyclase (GGDEF)-like protein